jgi:CRISPR/Cas system CSM-associated protein Csm3 (group 7 of RAMP superfamily)
MKRYGYEISVTLRTPFLVQGSSPGQFGLDAVQMRNEHRQRILPGTLVKGRIRHAWRELREMGAADVPSMQLEAAWFGERSSEVLNPGARENLRYAFDPVRGKVYDGDLVEMVCSEDKAVGAKIITGAEEQGGNSFAATRVSIDPVTGAAASGMLKVVEQGEAAGKSLVFRGFWTAWIESPPADNSAAEQAANALRLSLLAGLSWQTQLGSERSVGYGEVLTAQVVCKEIAPVNVSSRPEFKNRVRHFRIRFDRPLCVGTRSVRGNYFVSDSVLSGATLHGALANMLQMFGKKGADDALGFSGLGLSHGFPVGRDVAAAERIFVAPLSFASNGERLVDAALCEKHFLMSVKTGEGNGSSERLIAPRFSSDWKDKDRNLLPPMVTQDLKTHVVVRTAIDPATRQADEGQLFAYESKVTSGIDYASRITMPPGLSDQQIKMAWKVLEEALAHGLGPIGKTNAWGSIHWDDVSTEAHEEVSITSPPLNWGHANSNIDSLLEKDELFRLQLNTPALLFSTEELERSSLKTLYDQYFMEVSGGSISLSHYFATQSLAGGTYLNARYIRKKSPNRYLPYVLTNPGSIFVLKVNVAAASTVNKVRDWVRYGLGLTQATTKAHGATWDLNPFVRENGYGEVLINLSHPSIEVKQ